MKGAGEEGAVGKWGSREGNTAAPEPLAELREEVQLPATPPLPPPPTPPPPPPTTTPPVAPTQILKGTGSQTTAAGTGRRGGGGGEWEALLLPYTFTLPHSRAGFDS